MILLICLAKPLLLHAQSSTSLASTQLPSATVTFTIEGESNITLDSRVWDYPVSLYERAYFDVATLLNSLAPGTSTPVIPGTTSNATNATLSEEAPAEEGMKLWVILLISIGGVVVVGGVSVGIWFAVKNHNNQVQPTPPAENGRRMGVFQMVYPPPHAYSKVIQIPLTNHRIRPDYQPMGDEFRVVM